MKVILLGAPNFAVNVLKELLKSHHQVIGVVCQPDKKGNRNKLTPCAVKTFSKSQNLQVYDWEDINQAENVQKLQSLNPDVLVTAAYGQMLKIPVLELAPHGVINVHGSLLPKLRGASPVQHAIIEGETVTGVTIVKSVLKMDAGPLLLQASTEILPTDTADLLFDKLSVLGGELLVQALTLLEQGKAVFLEQDQSQVTFCKKIKATDEKIDWTLPATQVSAFIRGLSSNPGAFSYFGDKRIKIYNCVLASPPTEKKGAAGEIFYTKKQLFVFCGDGQALSITDLQLAESKRMRTVDFLNGLKTKPQSFSIE